jgi:hypothetical protein
LKFDYDASTGNYLVWGEQYGPADSNPCDGCENGNFRFFDPVSGWGDTLTVLTNSSNNSRIVLSYLSYGLYIPVNGPGVFNQPEVIAFIFGTETPAGNMPRTGSATYQGIVDGVAFDGAANKGFAAAPVPSPRTLQRVASAPHCRSVRPISPVL